MGQLTIPARLIPEDGQVQKSAFCEPAEPNRFILGHYQTPSSIETSIGQLVSDLCVSKTVGDGGVVVASGLSTEGPKFLVTQDVPEIDEEGGQHVITSDYNDELLAVMCVKTQPLPDTDNPVSDYVAYVQTGSYDVKVHVFDGRVLVTTRDCDTGERAQNFVVEANEQVIVDTRGDIVDMYSWNTNKPYIASLSEQPIDRGCDCNFNPATNVDPLPFLLTLGLIKARFRGSILKGLFRR